MLWATPASALERPLVVCRAPSAVLGIKPKPDTHSANRLMLFFPAVVLGPHPVVLLVLCAGVSSSSAWGVCVWVEPGLPSAEAARSLLSCLQLFQASEKKGACLWATPSCAQGVLHWLSAQELVLRVLRGLDPAHCVQGRCAPPPHHLSARDYFSDLSMSVLKRFHGPESCVMADSLLGPWV